MADIFLVTSLVLGCSVRRWWCDHVQSDNNRSSLLTHSALRCVVGLYLSLIALIQHPSALDHEMYVLHTCNTYTGIESHRSDIIALSSATDYRGVVGSSASAKVCTENRARV